MRSDKIALTASHEQFAHVAGSLGRRYMALPVLLILLLAGCSTTPPSNTDNICAIFSEKRSWYRAAQKSWKTWWVPIPTMMAIIHQESRFRHDARPPRKKILGFIPGPRPSDSYGYSQALVSTWRSYQRDTGHYGADRDNFADAIDFIGWYNHQSYRRSKIDKGNAYLLYLAYHEGHGGFNRGSYRSKPWLQRVAKKVAARSASYQRQFERCRGKLEERRGWFG